MTAPGPAWERGEACHVAMIVAHPDDETLWAGGLLLSHPEWSVFIITLCRGKDPDRAPRFRKALQQLGAQGAMGDLDDGPDQTPQAPSLVQQTILSLLPSRDYDLLLTHSPGGEYTRHLRHEEASRAVEALRGDGRVRAKGLWLFAYEDGGGAHLPLSRQDAQVKLPLSDALWGRKRAIITEVYGFQPSSWEARTTPRTEAFFVPAP